MEEEQSLGQDTESSKHYGKTELNYTSAKVKAPAHQNTSLKITASQRRRKYFQKTCLTKEWYLEYIKVLIMQQTSNYKILTKDLDRRFIRKEIQISNDRMKHQRTLSKGE